MDQPGKAANPAHGQLKKIGFVSYVLMYNMLLFCTPSFKVCCSSPLPPKPVLGYEFGMLFSAGVWPDSPTGDDTNCLSLLLFGRSVKKWRRFFWLRILSTRCASSGSQFIAHREEVARERQVIFSRKDL